MIELLLNHGAGTQVFDEGERNPPFAAASAGHAEVAKHILEKDPSFLDKVETTNGWTALHVAIDQNHEEIVSMLLEAGFNRSSRAQYKRTYWLKTVSFATMATHPFLHLESSSSVSGNWRVVWGIPLGGSLDCLNMSGQQGTPKI